MTTSSARVLQVFGGILFIIGAILLAVGTTSPGLFIFFGVLAVLGLILLGVGQSAYNKAIRR